MAFVCPSVEAALTKVPKNSIQLRFYFLLCKIFVLASRKTFPGDGKFCWNMELTPPDTSSRIQYSANSTKCSETDIGRGGGRGEGKLGGGGKGGKTAEKWNKETRVIRYSKTAWKWYHWTSLGKDITATGFLNFFILTLNFWKDFKVLSR